MRSPLAHRSLLAPLAPLAALCALAACGEPVAPTAAARPLASAGGCTLGLLCPSPYANDALFSRDLPTFLVGNVLWVLPNVHDLRPDGSVVKLAVGDDATWSTAHDRIVYAGYVPVATQFGLPFVHKIFVMNANGSGKTQLTFTASTVTDRSPVFSPDGTRIAFVSNRGGDDDIYVMNADGTNVVQLTQDWSPTGGSPADADPAWSPDGTKIAFASTRYGGWRILTMNADGSGAKVMASSTGALRHPSWSPDGSKIAFDGVEANYCGLYWEPSAGGAISIVPTTNLGGLDYCGYLRWAPNGQLLLFTANSAGYDTRLFRVKVSDGSGLTALTDGTDADHDTAWR